MNANLLDAAKSALRVWVFTTLGLWIPGLLGWINEVTEWASQKGAPAFPDPTNLAFLFVAALTAAFPAAVAGLWRFVENASGHTALPRASGPQPPAPVEENGMSVIQVTVIAFVVLLVLMVLVF